MPIPQQFRNANDESIPYDGSPLTWRVSAYALIFQDQQLLIIKDKSEKLHDIPGGGIEMDESIEEGLQREALEEAGATIKVKALVHTAQDYFYHTTEKKFYKTLQLFYLADVTTPLAQPSHDTTEWAKFVPLSKIGNFPLPQAVKAAIAKYDQKFSTLDR